MKAFVNDKSKSYPNVEVKNSPDDNPHLVFYNTFGEKVEDIIIAKTDTLEQLIKLLDDKGFKPTP